MAVDWDRPLRHRISGRQVFVVKASSTRNQVALGYSEHGPTEEMVMRSGMMSAHSEFLDLENCSFWDFEPEQKALSAKTKAAERMKKQKAEAAERRRLQAIARERDEALMEDNPLWGAF